MQAYGIVESASNDDLQSALTLFLNDSLFAIPLELARRSLVSRRRRRDPLKEDTGVHSFHIDFGNPFPGPYQGVAHHSVEHIYLWDAFHDALAKADKGIMDPYREPREVRLGESRASDSGFESPTSQGDQRSDTAPEQPQRQAYKRTNLELSAALQDHWLDFIVLDEFSHGDHSEEITVYGKDRATRVESLVGDSRWTVSRQRWELAMQDLDAMVRARRGLRVA